MSTRASTDPGSKSAAEIEREVQQSRAEIEHTLDAIQQRLSPGQLVDEALGYFRGGRGADFARNLGDSVAANPLPLTLMGVGLAWMMMSGQRSARPYGRTASDSDYWREELDPIEEPYAGYAGDDLAYLGPEASPSGGFGETDETGRSGGLGESVKDAGRSAADTAGELGDRARHAAEMARERARDVGAGARDRFGRARARVAGSTHDLRGQAGRYGRRIRRGVLDSLDEQPLVLGAIGLAIGAALGAALPPTETEDELMGDTRDEALHRATAAGREQAEKVRETAGAAVAAAREEVGKQGWTTAGSEESSGASQPGKASGLSTDTPSVGEPDTGLSRS